MTGRDDDFAERFIASLPEAERTSDLEGVLQETADRLGYTHFAYHIVRSPALDHSPARATFGLTSYPERWSNHYIDNGYVNDDPIVGRALVAREPFQWSSVVDETKLTARQKQIMSDARDIGIRDGLTIPLSPRHGERAAMTLIAGAETPELTPTVAGMIQLVSEFFHAHALRLVLQEEFTRDRKRRGSILSARERETLAWVSRGKSSWEIAQILGIAEKSVEFYVDSVKRKLQAANRTHAVVKALMLGLIEDPTLSISKPASR